MKKADKPEWAKRILKLLKQAKEKDANFEKFGADSHRYKMSAPASEDKVQKFEEQIGVRLPEEYRDFLMFVGNGGAGPYYGLFGLNSRKNEPHDSLDGCAQMEPVIYPKMSDEDWEKIVDSQDYPEGEKKYPYGGVLPIESQGCTLMTGLMLRGPYRGQVIYYDEDYCNKPFFVREKGFLAWYERWLREVIEGYDDDEIGFGMNIDGNPNQLMELYEQTKDWEEKIEIIDSYYKFKTLPDRQKTYFKQVCDQETNMKVRMKLIKMMAHFHVPGMAEEIDKLWEYGAYDEAISIICCESTREVKEAWCEKIFEILPKLRGEGFSEACYIFKALKDFPDVHAGRLKESLMREDLGESDRAAMFYCIRDLKGKEEILDYFLEYLSKEKNTYLQIYAIQAMDGVKARQLQEVYVKMLDKYKTHENARLDYEGSQMVLKGGFCMGAHRPEGQIVSNLMRQFEHFGLDYRGAWKLLMDDERWKNWKQQNGFGEL